MVSDVGWSGQEFIRNAMRCLVKLGLAEKVKMRTRKGNGGWAYILKKEFRK